MSETAADTAPAGTGSHDNTATLIRMANQIAQFFATGPEAEGVEGVASHINQFWDPRMRRRFLAAAEAHRSELHPLTAAALPQVRR